jgi:hypothetical protein
MSSPVMHACIQACMHAHDCACVLHGYATSLQIWLAICVRLGKGGRGETSIEPSHGNCGTHTRGQKNRHDANQNPDSIIDFAYASFVNPSRPAPVFLNECFIAASVLPAIHVASTPSNGLLHHWLPTPAAAACFFCCCCLPAPAFRPPPLCPPPPAAAGVTAAPAPLSLRL